MTKHERKHGIIAAIACVAISGIGLSLTMPLLSLEMERMGISNTWIGLNTAIAGLAAIVTLPFVPGLAARIGVGPLLFASVATIAVTMLLFKAIPVFEAWFVLRFIFSAALSAIFVLSEYWINTAAPPEKRGLVMGIYASVLALGFAAGPATLALVGTSGWPPYLAGTALFALAALPLGLARAITPDIGQSNGRSAISFLLIAPAATLAALTFGAVETGGFTLLPIYGLALGFSPEKAALLVSLMAIGNVLFQIPIGLLADRFDKQYILLIVGMLGAAGCLLMPLVAQNDITFSLLLVLWGGVIGALYTVGLAHLGARFTGVDLASANAAFVMLYSFGLIIGPIVAGKGLDAYRPHGFAYALAGIFLAYVSIIAMRLHKRT
jgi:MFS family permease